MKKYMIYLEDAERVYKVPVAAETEEKAVDYCHGNGELVAVKDVTNENDFLLSEEEIRTALITDGMDKTKIDFILTALYNANMIDI